LAARIAARGAIDGPTRTAFADLDPSTRAFLRRLRDDEIAQLQEAIDFMRSVRMVGRFTRWALYTVVAAFLGAIAVGEGFSSLRRLIAEWFNGGGR